MSGGIISGATRDDSVEHYYQQRYNELTLKSNRSLAATSTIGSLSQSTDNRQYFSNNRQTTNGSLTTNQFYKRNSNEDHLSQDEIIPTCHQGEGSSSYTRVSDSSVFKKPLPLPPRIIGPIQRGRLNVIVKSFLSTNDKPTFNFIMRTMEALELAINNPPTRPMDPVHLSDFINDLVKQEYLTKKFPKSIFGSSVMSDQLSCSDQSAANSERSIRLDKPSRTAPIMDSRVCSQGITQSMPVAQSNRPPHHLINPNESSISKIGLLCRPQLETSVSSKGASGRGGFTSSRPLIETFTGSTFNFFNDSEIAQMRDEVAASQEKSHSAIVIPKKKNGKAVTKPTPNPAKNSSKEGRGTNVSASVIKKSSNGRGKVSAPVYEKSVYEHENQNMSRLNGTACGTSRSGRILKPPVKYWDAKGEELSCEDVNMSVLNESMTLRNKKVVDRKKTPPGRGKNTTPVLKESKAANQSTTTKSRGKPKVTGKENKVVEKKKPEKTSADTPAIKNVSTKEKKEVSNTVQDTKSSIKKPAQKRKSKEWHDTASKKKKITDTASDIEEDDIFGAVTYRKPKTQNPKVALSPGAALLSAKKAAGQVQGKATPPCKTISDMMANDSVHSIMSAPREAPKQNEAIKRVIKKIDKNQLKASTQSKPKELKNMKKKDSQLNALLEAAKSKYVVSNPICSASLTLGEIEEEDDFSDMEEDEDLM